MAIRTPSQLAGLGSLLVFFLGACSSTAPTKTTEAKISYQPVPSLHVQQDHEGFYFPRTGLSAEYFGPDTSEEKMRRDLRTARELGGYFLRVGITWNETEVSPGKYLWTKWDLLFKLADEYQVTLLPYVTRMPVWAVEQKDPTRFASFMKEIASRYQGKVPSWELWDAPDQSLSWSGSPEDFVQIVSLAVASVREVDPNVKLVLGSMRDPIQNPFLKDLLDHSGFGELFDVIGISGNTVNPVTIRQVKNLVQLKAPGRDLWWTTLGDSLDAWRSQLQLASTESLSLFTWSPDLLFGKNGEKKPAYEALRALNRILDRPYRRMTSKIQIDKRKHSSLVVEAFEKQNDQWLVSAWLRIPNNDERFSLTFPRNIRRVKADRIRTSGKLVSTEYYNHHIPNIQIENQQVWSVILQPEQSLSGRPKRGTRHALSDLWK